MIGGAEFIMLAVMSAADKHSFRRFNFVPACHKYVTGISACGKRTGVSKAKHA